MAFPVSTHSPCLIAVFNAPYGCSFGIASAPRLPLRAADAAAMVGPGQSSAISTAAMSLPAAFRIPQARPRLQASVPSVPVGQEHRTSVRSRPPPATSWRSLAVALAARLRSASYRARLSGSGVSKPTRRTVCPRAMMLSPSMTWTEAKGIGSAEAVAAIRSKTQAKRGTSLSGPPQAYRPAMPLPLFSGPCACRPWPTPKIRHGGAGCGMMPNRATPAKGGGEYEIQQA